MLYRSDLNLIKLASIIEDDVEDIEIFNKNFISFRKYDYKCLLGFHNDLTLSLISGFKEAYPLRKLNDWNREATLISACADSEGRTMLQADFYIGEGLTEEQICGFVNQASAAFIVFAIEMDK